MEKDTFTFHSRLAFPAQEVFDWHMRPGAIERLTPAWTRIEVNRRARRLGEGSLIELTTRIGPFKQHRLLERLELQPGRRFCDIQLEGPYPYWKHDQRFIPLDSGGCRTEDRLDYLIPYGRAGMRLAGGKIRKNLELVFEYRQAILARDLETHRRIVEIAGRRFKVLVTGSSGMIGRALVNFLASGGHTVIRLVRSREPASEGALYWDPAAGVLSRAGLEGLDAVVHLAGENVAAGRWTKKRMARLIASRLDSTRLLGETLKKLAHPPEVFLCASACGYYGDRGAEILDEEGDPGEGFLAGLASQWEAAAASAGPPGIRVVNLRFGMVLSPSGGALAALLPLFRLGAGGRLGNGKQYVSWISIEDALHAMAQVLVEKSLRGPVNLVSPGAVTNSEFAGTLAHVLKRPALLPAPAPALKIALGRMAEEMLLSGCLVRPAKLEAGGFKFAHPELEAALRFLLGR